MTSPHDHIVVVRPGSNSWLLARTDRDAAERSTVIESSGAFLNRVLNQASPAGLRGIFQILQVGPTGGRFVIGAARPMLVTANDQRPERPEGLARDRQSTDGLIPRRVRALKPWFLQVVFEWHGGIVKLPWPQHFGAVLGSELESDVELDWLLLESHKAVTT
jgi:hypothetical protein